MWSHNPCPCASGNAYGWFVSHVFNRLDEAVGQLDLAVVETFLSLAADWKGSLSELVQVVAFTTGQTTSPETPTEDPAAHGDWEQATLV